MEFGRSARGGAGQQCSYGESSTTDRKFCSTDSGALALARAAQRRGGAGAALNDHRKLAVLTILAVVTRARGAPIPASSERRPTCSSRLGGAAAAGRRRHFFLADCCWQVRGDDGARAIGDADVASPVGGGGPAPVERSELRGHRQRSQNSAALTVGRLLSLARRSGCGGAGAALNDHRNLAALTILAVVTRARGARRFQRALTQTDLLEPPGRRCGCWSTSPFLFSGLLLAGSGRRWSSGDRAIAGAPAALGRRRSSAGSYGVIDNDRKILQH